MPDRRDRPARVDRVDRAERESELVVVVAPTLRDGQVTERILREAGIECALATDRAALESRLAAGIGALVVTDVTLAGDASRHLLGLVERQPAWSDLAVLALCRPGPRAPATAHALGTLRNVTVLDRPASTQALVSAVRVALRGRRWQYQIRDQIDALMRADRSLREADRRKDEFLATLAHELRNPLAPIKTGLDILARSPNVPPEFERVSAMMGRQLSQLVRLIDELLEVSRISTGKLVLQRERIDMRQVVTAALESCQPLIERAGHRLTVAVPDLAGEHALEVDGDAARLTQALSNLINNAVKYTPDGGRIELRLAGEGDEVVVSVTDSGLGIPAEMLERVFDMFAQVNRTLERAQGGLGIGLALVRSLVTLHGGQVSAASAGPGQGSRFTIRLPRANGHEACAVAPALQAWAATSRCLRILVVDDNADAADTLAMLLSLGRHEVRVEHAAEAALPIAAAFQPQAIFCDIGMPGMGGLEFAAQLRQDPRFAKTLLVAVTGWGAEQDQRRSRGAGFDAHLTKPASVESLSALLARL